MILSVPARFTSLDFCDYLRSLIAIFDSACVLHLRGGELKERFALLSGTPLLMR